MKAKGVKDALDGRPLSPARPNLKGPAIRLRVVRRPRKPAAVKA